MVALALFTALAVAAHFIPYFPLDLTITRALQAHHDPLTDGVMRGLSWIGFEPQVEVLGTLIVVALFVCGLRWEAVAGLFAALGPLLGNGIKLLVARPRPSAALVHVVSQLDTLGFPSGHVVAATAFGGYLASLAYTLLARSWARTVILVLLGAIIVLMGPSRVMLGHHWFSDVLGAYLFGTFWMALTVRFYRWGKPRFFVRQPVAPEKPV